MSRFSAPIAEQIWDMKYRLKTADDEPIDATLLWKILNFCPPAGLPLAPGRSAKSRCSIAL